MSSDTNRAVQVYVDSTYRNGGSTSKFPYQLKDNIKANHFKLTSAEIPLTFYNVRSSGVDANNIFYFSEDNGATTRQATLTAGFYTAGTMTTSLKTAMDSASGIASTYTVSFSTLTSKYTISSTANFKVMYPSWLSVNWICGYNAASSNATSNVANTCPYFDYYQYFYLRLSINAQMCYDETGSVNRIFKIPITNPAGSVQFYFDVSDNHFQILDEKAISSFTVELLDSDYVAIDLNGREYSFTLTFYY